MRWQVRKGSEGCVVARNLSYENLVTGSNCSLEACEVLLRLEELGRVGRQLSQLDVPVFEVHGPGNTHKSPGHHSTYFPDMIGDISSLMYLLPLIML